MLRRALFARNLPLHLVVSKSATFVHFVSCASCAYCPCVSPSLSRLVFVRHRGALLPSGSSSTASRPNRRKSVYLAPRICRAAMQPDSRRSLKPKSASWVAAMVAMVSGLDGRSGHDQGGRAVVKWWSMREPKRDDAGMDSQARVAAARRFDRRETRQTRLAGDGG
ncbi:hypothetical protein LI328DRAFT_26192 [Trichoderma asperelloides]|nr:hypothetical protein LI328DRAFT_26192 [Trichoderma asperelloides]